MFDIVHCILLFIYFFSFKFFVISILNVNYHFYECCYKYCIKIFCFFQRPIRFAVRSLGWVEIAEADLTPERSSKAVNKCIVDLSMGRKDILDVVGRWGDVS